MENEAEFTDALTRLPFTPIGPTNWQSCHRAIGSHGYGPSVGFTMLGLVNRLGTPEDGEQWLTVTVTDQPALDSGRDRAIDAALRRMTMLNPNATVTAQRQQKWGVRGQEVEFHLVELSDGQWFARAEASAQSITISGKSWPLDKLRLVEVDPLMYVSGRGAYGE